MNHCVRSLVSQLISIVDVAVAVAVAAAVAVVVVAAVVVIVVFVDDATYNLFYL